MNTYIALLRGVNVGGKNKVLMKSLRGLLTKNEFYQVQTYIQSGNVIFKSNENDISQLEDKITKYIQLHFSVEVPVLVITLKEFQDIFDNCPFSKDEKQHSYFSLLFQRPDKSLLNQVSKHKY